MPTIAEATIDLHANAAKLRADLARGEQVMTRFGRRVSAGGAGFNASGIAGAGSTVFPFAEGGDGVVRKPTLFLAGEAGPERFAFTPMGKGGGDDGSFYQIIVEGDADEAKIERVLKRHIPGIVKAAEGQVNDRARRTVGRSRSIGR
ncbi:MAG: hypothetical protein AB7S71_01410 [Dongiaceae bacterium]